jgi:hypothetical protein
VDELLNLAFFVLHTSWIGFNCAGWIWRRTRRWHLLTVFLTAVSWFGLGYRYGWGYCPCTDWHWQVRARLGYRDPDSYTQLLIRELIGIDLLPAHADALTAAVFALVTLLSITLKLRDRGRGSAAISGAAKAGLE